MAEITTTWVCKCGGEMKPSKAIVCKPTGYRDFPSDNHACTVSPDPRKPVLVDCLKCEKCGHSESYYVCHEDHPALAFDEKYAL